MGKLPQNRGKNLKIKPRARRSNHRRSARISDLNVTRNQACNQGGRAFDENKPRLDSVLCEKPLFLSDDQRNGPWTDRRIAYGDLDLGECGTDVDGDYG